MRSRVASIYCLIGLMLVAMPNVVICGEAFKVDAPVAPVMGVKPLELSEPVVPKTTPAGQVEGGFSDFLKAGLWSPQVAPYRGGALEYAPTQVADAVLYRRLSEPEKMSVEASEVGFEVCLDKANQLRGLEREAWVSLARRHWRRVWPGRDDREFAAALKEKLADASDAERVYLVARLSGEAAIRYRDDLVGIIDDPAVKDQRDEILLLVGSIDIRADNPEGAIYLEKLVTEHRESPSVPRALLLLGWNYVMEGEEAKAVERLRRLVREYPRHELAPRARELLTGLAVEVDDPVNNQPAVEDGEWAF